MTDAVRALVRLSAAIGRGDGAAVRAAAEAAAGVARPVEVEEAILQSHLFAGYPAMLQAMAAWRTVVPAPAATLDADSAAREDWRRRGETVCAQVYGGQYGKLRQNVDALHPVLDRWMVEDGYGRVLGRPGLALEVRELCIVALLCAQDAPAQLYAHLRGALNAGAPEADVSEAVGEGAAGLAERRAVAARETWAVVRDRRGSDG